MAPTGAHFGNIVTTVYAAILREIRAEGEASRFVKTGRGLFAINPTILEGVAKPRKAKAEPSPEVVPEPTPAIADGTEGPESLQELFRI